MRALSVAPTAFAAAFLLGPASRGATARELPAKPPPDEFRAILKVVAPERKRR